MFMTIGKKISLFLVVPSCVIIVCLVSSRLLVAIEEYKILHQVERLSALSVQIGAANHSLQIERGATAGFISSKNGRFGDVLPDFRASTSGALESMRAAYKDLVASTTLTGMHEPWTRAQESIGGLEAIRRKADDLSISAVESNRFFTQAISDNMKVFSQLMTQVATADTSRRALVYQSILNAKERTGQERALLMPVFTLDAPNLPALLLAAQHQEAQQLWMEQVVAHGDGPEISRLREVNSENSYNSFIARCRSSLGAKAATGGYQVDSAAWFGATTERINALKTVEDIVAINLSTTAREGALHARNVVWIGIVASVVALAVFCFVCLLLVRNIVAPVSRVGSVLAALAEGDLTKRSEVSSRDEFGAMATALNGTLEGLRGTVCGIGQSAQGIAGAAEELSAVSKQLAGTAETTSGKSGLAATAATEIASNINTFAAGVEEMGVTVSEIAKNASQAASVAQEGVAATEDANKAMTRLGTSSNEIGDIVKVITSIAEQTNLLALNATIEAARAGDAGRGFAVVASEVKDLASKTAEATADIRNRISGIQSDSNAAQSALKRITTIVGKINDLQQSIATAVEEQSATNKELAGNIGQVSQAGRDISVNVNAVAGAAKEAAVGAGETLKAANELAKLAAELRHAMARFRT
jgi:methyl-accepting chemotaxis protein